MGKNIVAKPWIWASGAVGANGMYQSSQPDGLPNIPIILFASVSSGPKTGWSAAEPNKGVVVTLYGLKFGALRRTSYVTCCGVSLTADNDYAEPWATAVTQTPDVNGVSDTFSVTTLAATAPVMPADTTADVTEPGQVFGIYAASNTPDPSAVYTLSGADSGVLSINSSTGAVTVDAPTDEGAKDAYAFTVTATNSGGDDSQNVVVTIVEAGTGNRTKLSTGIGIGI